MKNNMSSEEKELFSELKKLVNQANARIRYIEKETGISESFAVKQLIDYLSSKPISAVTKSGRVSLRKDYTFMQQQAIIKAIKEFKDKAESSAKGIKQYVSKYSKIAGKKLSFKMASAYYQVTHNLDWLYDANLTPSIFWRDFAPRVNTTPKEDWIELVSEYKANTPDRTIRNNLGILYDYLKNG